jgi:hypothetical protein
MTLYNDYASQHIAQGAHDVLPSGDDALCFVQEARIGDGWLHPGSSNYTFVVEISMDGGRPSSGFGVYKPERGEAPLWDFRTGSLYHRECAAYELNHLLGWDFVPPTVIREGEAGVGSLQLYVPSDERANFFTMRESHREVLERMAVFDLVANNADRKGGHCLLAGDGRLWGVDHGLTFHEEYKLRTVVWDFAGESVPAPLIADLGCLEESLCKEGSEATERLALFLSPREMEALRSRVHALLEQPVMPQPYSRRDLPWPWV